MRGHVSAIYASAFFHLFPEEKQTLIAQKLAGILSPEPGSMLLGSHGGRATKGIWTPAGRPNWMFCHSPESWRELWEGIFGKGKVEVKASLRKEIGGVDFFGQYAGNTEKDHFMVLEWSVTRL